jgi:hypothetical protein
MTTATKCQTEVAVPNSSGPMVRERGRTLRTSRFLALLVSATVALGVSTGGSPAACILGSR